MRAAPYYSEHENFIDSVTKLTQQEIAPKLTAWEKAGDFSNDAFKLLDSQGYLGLLISEEYGGS